MLKVDRKNINHEGTESTESDGGCKLKAEKTSRAVGAGAGQAPFITCKLAVLELSLLGIAEF